jgi:hypothetical protein
MTRAKGRTKVVGEHETHHIVPRSLGGTNGKDNLVHLTYREHFLAHWLLTKFTEGLEQRKMLHAMSYLTVRGGGHEHRVTTGWQYAKAKLALSVAAGIRMRELGDSHHMKDPERAAAVGAKVSLYQKSLGDKHSSKRPERRAELRENWSGDKHLSRTMSQDELNARGQKAAKTRKERYGDDRPWQKEASRKQSETLRRIGHTIPNTPENHLKSARTRKERGVHAGDNNPSRRMSKDKLVARAVKAAATRQISRKGFGDEHPFKRPEVVALISGENHYSAKEIVNVTTGTIFGTIDAAAKDRNVHAQGVLDVCRGRQKTAGKCKFVYLNSPEGYVAAVALLARKRLMENFA